MCAEWSPCTRMSQGQVSPGSQGFRRKDVRVKSPDISLGRKKIVSGLLASAHTEGRTDSVCALGEVRLNSSALLSPNSLVVNLLSSLIPNHKIKALVDSGSTHCFIETKFVRKYNIRTRSVDPIPLRLFNGSTNSVITEAIELPITFPNGHTHSVDCYVTL
jgi:Retroviral aspartyl protease